MPAEPPVSPADKPRDDSGFLRAMAEDGVRIAQLTEALELLLDCRGAGRGTVSRRGGEPAVCRECAATARVVLAGARTRPMAEMPEGFTDRAAWDAIHWRFSVGGSLLDEAVIGWQRENPERVKAAIQAELAALRAAGEATSTESPRD